MKHKTKRFLSMLLSFSILSGVFPVGVFANTTEEESIELQYDDYFLVEDDVSEISNENVLSTVTLEDWSGKCNS